MSDELERIEGAEDSEKPERRRIPLLLIIALLAVCATLGVFGAFASGALGRDEATQRPPPTDEPLVDTATETFTPIPTTETETFTPTYTNTPSDTPTPTDTATFTPTATDTPDRGSACVCGDGVCCGGERTSCTADCGGDSGVCANNGGLAWQGEVCVCPGVVDVVTYCNDGSHTDQVTDRSCQPPQDCAPPPPNCAPVVCTCSGGWPYTKTCSDQCGNVTVTTGLYTCP